MNIKDEVTFVQIMKDKEDLVAQVVPNWIAYMREIYQDDKEIQVTADDEITDWLMKRVKIQGKQDTMHFEAILYHEEVIGFAMYAVDLGGIKNVLEAGYGYIMELYVRPEYRRKGIGETAYLHMKKVFREHEVTKMYLTPDSQSGVPFWLNMGFHDSKKIDPDNHLPIYISELIY